MKSRQIAIVGAGIAGLAAAILLHEDGHDVTLYEKFAAPQPLGAGILLQPTGLAVLHQMGLDTAVIQSGSVINRLYGKVADGRFATLDVNYKTYAAHYFGVGSHRGDIFSILYQKALANGIRIVSASDIVSIDAVADQTILTDAQGEKSGAYDLVIDASGARSQLRTKYADIKLDRPYPYGALWGTVMLRDGVFALDTLEQRYKNAEHMLGILPVGKNSDGMATRAAFFWSMRVKDYPQWRQNDLAQWKDYVGSFWPQTREVLKQIKTHDDLSLGTYRDVILRRYHTGNLVFIGDAAHCSSPQLGQGANMGLVDAYVLRACIREQNSITSALESYTMRRRRHVRFYQTASRMLTPFFQSDSYIFGKLRFLLCGVACHIPFTQKIAAQVLCGVKTGLFSSLNPGDWADIYSLRKR